MEKKLTDSILFNFFVNVESGEKTFGKIILFFIVPFYEKCYQFPW